MPKMIKLHHYISGKSIWLNPDAIVSVIVDAPTEGTSVYTYTYAGDSIHYRVVEMIEKACNPLNSYTCIAPDSINWAVEK